MKTRREFMRGVGAGLTGGILTRGLPWVGGALLWPRRVEAVTTLDPHDPTATFVREGGGSFTPGSVLTLTDVIKTDFIAFVTNDLDATPGIDVDVIATFQVTQFVPDNADVGNRVVINDGMSRSAIASCIIQNGLRGIGLYSQGLPGDPASYPVFVPVDWTAAPVTIRMRRTAIGDAEIVEVNGVAPSPRALLSFNQAPASTRVGATVEFGGSAESLPPECTVQYHAFRSERVAQPGFPLTITPAHAVLIPKRIQGIALHGSFQLAPSSNGIDPVSEGATVALSTPAGLFYPLADVMPVVMHSIRGGWGITDAERSRTGIEFFVIQRTANASRFRYVFLDGRSSLPGGDYSQVRLDLEIGDDQGGVDMHLVEVRQGLWSLAA